MNKYYITNLLFKKINIKQKNIIILKIICYNINNEINYPFMQIMLEKDIENNLILPYIKIENIESNNIIIDEEIINKVYLYLLKINNNIIDIIHNNIIIDGYFFDIKKNEYIVFVNINNININFLSLNIETNIWFALVSEIINYKSIYNNIKIHKNTYNFFIEYKKLLLLYKDENRIEFYNIPDPYYTIDEINKNKFNLIFGKIPINNKYYFYKEIPNNINTKYSIIRYAIFYNEIDSYDNNLKNNITITKYDNFYPLSDFTPF